ncbi:conserved hypothetical protein [Leishmania mexicana MHOM/GT/2001/U1103]|uniref:SPRY domain-containing protein n=1 Tax=Leishmania mexicana (strain MHOM/GT/2001/U1103) TaxID=929439 RepID=E9AT63_LEIMU|nr:conserved hypothetical protein [Leishmania mexicana MHOM/GT/2001/U1103]CBZ26137.1 conserved hypothetical protein [Leishmania mexicana MHOM/GT/2001/U1103]
MFRMPAVKKPFSSHRLSDTQKSIEDGAPSPYVPATPTSVTSVTFDWAHACPIYTIKGNSVWHKGGGELPYRPVIGDLAMRPNTGKYLFSYRINTDNSRVGFCTSCVYTNDEDLQNIEFGKAVAMDAERSEPLLDQNLAQPSFLQAIGAVPTPPSKPWEAYMDLQTSKVFVNGVEKHSFWRLFVPISGGVASFVVDTNAGAVQMFMNGKYVGMMLDEQSGLKGNTVYPCVGISGCDMANRSIESGCMGAFVEPAHAFECLY